MIIRKTEGSRKDSKRRAAGFPVLIMMFIMCAGIAFAPRTVSANEAVSASSISITSVSIKYTVMKYTGKARTQDDTTVVKADVNGTLKKLKYGTDYTITYKNNTNVGTAKMIVKGKGKYTGTITKTFMIYPTVITKWVTVPGCITQDGRTYDGQYLLIRAKQGTKTLWTKKTTKMIAAQIAGAGLLDCAYEKYANGYSYYKARNKSGFVYYYDNGNIKALDIFTGEVKWTRKSIVSGGTSAVTDAKGNLYVIKCSNPCDNTGNCILYTINKKGTITAKVNWSDSGKYSGSTSGGASIQKIKNGNIVMNVELRGQWFNYREIHVNPSTGKVVKVV